MKRRTRHVLNWNTSWKACLKRGTRLEGMQLRAEKKCYKKSDAYYIVIVASVPTRQAARAAE